jgi:hypothetical protein
MMLNSWSLVTNCQWTRNHFGLAELFRLHLSECRQVLEHIGNHSGQLNIVLEKPDIVHKQRKHNSDLIRAGHDFKQ